MSAAKNPTLQWLCTGREIFPAMLAAIAAAQQSIQLETYIFADGKLGQQVLAALLAAAQRGWPWLSARWRLWRFSGS
jgi:cardiolipin synthase